MSMLLFAAVVSASVPTAAERPWPIAARHDDRVRQTAERPAPPGFASPTLHLPRRDASGAFVTPNSGQHGASAFWHMRIALNVAALGCRGAHEAAALQGFRTLVDRHALAVRQSESHVIASLASQGGIAARDRLSTRLYNYFAQPPVQAEFCAVAADVGREVAATNPETVVDRSADWLVRLDQPFQNFYDSYANWQRAATEWDRSHGTVTIAALRP